MRRGLEIMERDDHFWEEDGGGRAEWLKICRALETALKPAPSETSPLDVIAEGTLPRPSRHDLKDSEKAIALRRALEIAASNLMSGRF